MNYVMPLTYKVLVEQGTKDSFEWITDTIYINSCLHNYDRVY
jgi:hypothetical protein